MSNVVSMGQKVENHFLATVFFKLTPGERIVNYIETEYVIAAVVQCGPTQNPLDALEITFESMQNEDQCWEENPNVYLASKNLPFKRSIRVGDVVYLHATGEDRQEWLCDAVGWKNLITKEHVE